jgi:hypothetical protein
MGKIPIGRTIGEAFDFALGRYLVILGVIWLPLVLLAAMQYFVLVPYFGHLFEFIRLAAQHAKDHPGPPPELAAMRPLIWSVDALAVVISIWTQVGITKTVFDLRTGPRFFYIPVGLDELRVIGGYLVFIAILYGALLALGIVIAVAALFIYALVSGGALAAGFSGSMRPWLGGGLIACAAAIAAAVIYVQVRFTFLLVPATVAEKRFGLWRSWQLSKGNFWRIFVVGVGTLSPILVFEFFLIFAFYIVVIMTLIAKLSTLQAHGVHAHGPQAVAAFMALVWRYAVVYGALAAAVIVPLLPIAFGLRFSPPAFAYRALTQTHTS